MDPVRAQPKPVGAISRVLPVGGARSGAATLRISIPMVAQGPDMAR